MHGNAIVKNYQRAPYGVCFDKKCTILRRPTIKKNIFRHRKVRWSLGTTQNSMAPGTAFCRVIEKKTDISNKADRAPNYVVRCQVGHRPILQSLLRQPLLFLPRLLGHSRICLPRLLEQPRLFLPRLLGQLRLLLSSLLGQPRRFLQRLLIQTTTAIPTKSAMTTTPIPTTAAETTTYITAKTV